MDRSTKGQLQLLKKVNVKRLFMLLSVSLFSLVFSSGFLHHFNVFYASTTFPLRLFTHAVDKNCLFLICNGILVFLAKSSGLIKGSRLRLPGQKQAESVRVFEYEDERLSGDLRGSVDSPVESTNGYPIEEVNKDSEDMTEESEASKGGETIGSVGGGGGENLVEEREAYGVSTEEENDHHHDDLMEECDEEEEEEDAFGSKLLSTEELNKKFDEFIRRMKEEIRIEEQQQLVMV